MSETGATAEQIEAAAKRAWAASGSLVPFDDVEPGGGFADGDKRVLAKEWSQYLVPPGYQIVPAGAVTLSAEEATDARACALARAKARSTEARGFRLLRNQQEAADEAEREAERYRALAAKLSGGAS